MWVDIGFACNYQHYIMKPAYITLFLLVGISCCQVSVFADSLCDTIDEFPCDDKRYCILRTRWCDSIPDCLDGSDELYCSAENPCLSNHIPCANGRCVPSSALCDGYDDCTDFSDEVGCFDDEKPDIVQTISPDRLFGYNGTSVSSRNASVIKNINERAIAKAAEYLLEQRDSDYGWGAFTPRAVVALSFANRIVPIVGSELLEKKVNVQLMLDLMQDAGDMSSSTLALYINALYATCQDPRNFRGIDLIARLRFKTNVAIKVNSTIPVAFLTLCIAGEMKESDAYHLGSMYYGQARTSSRALMVMAMICYENKNHVNVFSNYIKGFFSASNLPAEETDIHTRALFMQASNARGNLATNVKLNAQLQSGSYGDMLATYYAIPVLMNSSLLDLKCNTTVNSGASFENLLAKSNGTNRVVYSLWISTGNDVNSHSLTLTFDGDKSFFDIMLMAAERDPLYKFHYDETNDGKRVFSIGGVPNDAESGKSWMLYRGTVNHVMVNSVQNLVLENFGVDRISAESRSHFVFWFKRGGI